MLILKGILLYASVMFYIFFLCAVDSITAQGKLDLFILISVVLGFMCYFFLTLADVEKLSLTKYFDKLLSKIL